MVENMNEILLWKLWKSMELQNFAYLLLVIYWQAWKFFMITITAAITFGNSWCLSYSKKSHTSQVTYIFCTVYTFVDDHPQDTLWPGAFIKRAMLTCVPSGWLAQLRNIRYLRSMRTDFHHRTKHRHSEALGLCKRNAWPWEPVH